VTATPLPATITDTSAADRMLLAGNPLKSWVRERLPRTFIRSPQRSMNKSYPMRVTATPQPRCKTRIHPA